MTTAAQRDKKVAKLVATILCRGYLDYLDGTAIGSVQEIKELVRLYSGKEEE